MSKTVSMILVLVLMLSLFTACGSGEIPKEGKKIVCTVFPLYDWTKNVAGEERPVSLLVKNGTDVHSFQPSAGDVAEILSADLFIYIGGESDEWVEKVLNSAGGEKVRTLCLLDALGDRVKNEELAEGMEGEAEEDAPDEHIWLSLENALFCTEAICGALSESDSANRDAYRENADRYLETLTALRDEYIRAASGAARETVIFADRFPFRYLTEEMGLDYYAAFSGCSAESEASFKTVIFLAEKADEYLLETLLVTESSDGRLAETVKAGMKLSEPEILTLDSMQSVTESMIENGYTYASVMKNNLAVLERALD